MFKAAIFDIDGTLVDSNDLHARSWQIAFKHFGFELSYDAIRHQIGKGGDQLIPVFVKGDDLSRYGKEIDQFKTQLFMREYLPQVQPFPRVRELFDRLHAQGTRIVLATSAKGEELAAYKKLCDALELAEEETSSAEAERSKPSPDIFAAALEKGGVHAAEAIAVGDSPYDAQAATRLGIRVIGLLCGGFEEQELRRAGCCAIYKDPADLYARFNESPLFARATEAA